MGISKAFLVKVYLIYSTETKKQISKLQQKKKKNIIWVIGKKALLWKYLVTENVWSFHTGKNYNVKEKDIKKR